MWTDSSPPPRQLNLDDRGYMTVSIDDIVAMMNVREGLPDDEPIEADEVLAVQHRLQFDPVGARQH